jgi:hypothetical protein
MHGLLPKFVNYINIILVGDVGDRVMTVGVVMTVPNKLRLCAVLMSQTVITMPTVITLSPASI